MLRRVVICTLVAALAATCAATAARPAAGSDEDAQSLRLVLQQLPLQYEGIDRTHDTGGAAELRRTVAAAAAEARTLGRGRSAAVLDRLGRSLAATKVRLQPWPFVADVRSLAAGAGRGLPPVDATVDPYRAIDDELAAARSAAAAGNRRAASFQLAAAAARYRTGPGLRLQALDPSLSATTLAHIADGDVKAARDDVRLSAQTLGEVTVSRGTIVGDAAVIVFREGLEAVLILAALTASFVGVRRRLRAPVLVGAIAGLGVTALTWVAAQTIISSLSTGGLELQAITGLLAIGVLLLVTNWFFHRVYWSEWIGRFNKRRKGLETVDRGGFISGQFAGLVLLGLTSVYREGFETVLFLQSLQVTAGTGATMLGVGIGLALTFAVGFVCFKLQRKLPYKRMLIVTGVLIAFVLAIMVGTTVHTMQGLGWVSIHDTPFRTPLWATTWLGMFPTWETLAAQLAALVVVLGSYFVARSFQVGHARAMRRRWSSRQAAPTPALGD